VSISVSLLLQGPISSAKTPEVHFMPQEGNDTINQKVLTSRLFADYLDCPMKCFLRATGAPVGENILAVAKEKRSESYGREAIIQRFGESNAVLDRKIRTQCFEARVQIVQPLRPKATSPMLIHFVPTNKVTRNDKLGATFNAMVLSKSQRGEINLVRLVHGHHWTILSAKASTLFVCRARSYQICASRKKANRANVDNTRFPQLAVRRKENCGTENSLESCDKPSILFTAFVHSERVEHLRAS